MPRLAAAACMLLLGGCGIFQPAEERPKPTIATPPASSAPVKPATQAAAAKVAAPVKAPAAAAAKPAPAATLDLKTLEQQLKETKAIGVMTKLSIKNQVDDLLDQFRAYYQGKLKTPLSDLRRSYDLLVMKVLTLLQEGDQALAKAVANSREAIWGILADPNKFAKI